MTGRQDEESGAESPVGRLLWFRADHTDSEIETELVISDAGTVVMRAILRTREAGQATGHGSASREEDGPGYVEAAEDRALSRALTNFGYHNDPPFEVARDNEGAGAVPIDLVSARSLLRDERSGYEPGRGDADPPPQPIHQPAESGDDDDSGPDVNWNKFWNWARPRGYTNAKDLSELLGVESVLAHTPREVRQMIVRFEMDNPPGGPEE